MVSLIILLLQVLLLIQSFTTEARLYWPEYLHSLEPRVADAPQLVPSRPTDTLKSHKQYDAGLSSRELASNSTGLNLSDTTLPHDGPAYNIFDYFVFKNFPSDPDEYRLAIMRIINSMLGVQLVLAKAVPVLAEQIQKPTPDDGTCLRYFYSEDLDTVKRLFTLLSAVLGTPAARLDHVRNCLYSIPTFKKMELYTTCSEEGTIAYYSSYKDAQVPGNFRGPWIEPGCKDRTDEPSRNNAQTLLHELMHWEELTTFAYSKHIVDVWTLHPNGKYYQSYGAYFSMHVKDWATHGEKPLDNVDNYVFLTWELYYKTTYDLAPWQDPPRRVEGDETNTPDPCAN